jgi:hypothetical protein
MLFAALFLDQEVHRPVGAIRFLNTPIEIIIGIMLWLQIKQVPERAIADLPKLVNF